MKSTALQSTLREIRQLAGDIRAWAVLAVLSLVVGLVGPFGTFEMPALGRIAYWTAVVFATAIGGTLVAGYLERLLGPRLPRLPAIAVAGLAGALAGLPVTGLVILINLIGFGLWFQPIHAASLLFYCSLISAAVTVLGAIFAQQAPLAASPLATPALLDRLPLPQRGRLLHLAVADHYVEVTTDKGRALLLLRLSDAIREAAPVPGLQVHRSHWIALDAVRRTSRQSGKPVLELETGAIIPVSRSYLAQARAAGLVS